MSSQGTDKPSGTRVVPDGLKYFRLVWKQEDSCEELTDKLITKLGNKLPVTCEKLGTALSRMEMLATCGWGCLGGDHLIEHLVGRVVSSARASLRLLRFGFYDEALSLTRSIGECANLFVLFRARPGVIREWKAADKKTRETKFKPVKVRELLEEAKAPIPMNKDIYSLFSEVSAHPTPETKPQVHNPYLRPTLGGYLQPGGLLPAINELSYVVAAVGACAPGLTEVAPEHRKAVFSAARDLEKSLGGLSLAMAKDLWTQSMK